MTAPPHRLPDRPGDGRQAGGVAAPPGAPDPRTGEGRPRALGWLLLAPMVLGWLWWLVRPTWSTVRAAFSATSGPGGETRWVGGVNWDRLFDDRLPFGDALAFGLSLAVLPVLAVVVLGPALAYALHRAGRAARTTGRVLLAVPLLVGAPTLVAVCWLQWLALGGGPVDDVLTGRGGATTVVRLVVTATTLGVTAGLAVPAYLAALHRPDEPTAAQTATGTAGTPHAGAPTGTGGTAGVGVATSDRAGRAGAVAVLGAVGALAAVAYALQTFAVPYVLTRGGPDDATTTPMVLVLRLGAERLDVGLGSAVSTVLLGILGVLGTIAVVLLVATRARLLVAPGRRHPAVAPAPAPRPGPAPGGLPPALATVVAAVLLAGVVGVTGVALWPVLRTVLGGETSAPLASPGDVTVRTVLPPLLAVLVQVPLAWLGGIGVGFLRPLGRWSEWLLLPFAPWLFVTTAPLALTYLGDTRESGSLDSLPGQVPPILVSVPALILFTLLGAGQARVWAARRAEGAAPAPAFVRAVLLPTLPAVALVAVAGFAAQAHALLWPLLTGLDPASTPASALLLRNVAAFRAPGPLLALLASVGVPLVVLAVVILQVTWLPRLRFRVGGRG